MTSSRSMSYLPTLKGLLNLLLVLIAAFWFSKNGADADLWGHIKYGQDLLRSWQVPEKDPYSYTATDLPWINHEIAAEVCLALLFRSGNVAIMVWKLAMGLATIGLAAWLSRGQRITPLPWLLLASSIVAGLSLGWAPRPQLFGYVFFPLLLVILHSGERRPWMLTWSIPLLAAWVNFHGGFLFGLGIFGFYLLTKISVELWLHRFENRQLLLIWCVVGLAALLGTLCNPYGIGMYEGLYRELGIGRPQIGEWLPVNWFSTDLMVVKLLMLYTICAMAWSRKPMPLYQRVLFVVLLIETQLHIRHEVFLAIAMLAWLPEHFQDLWDRSSLGNLPWPILPRRAMAVATALALLFSSALVVGTVRRLSVIRVERSEWPVDAFEYISRHQLSGKMVVDMNWGQYAIYALYPNIRVSFDGRYGTCYSAEVLDMNFDLWMPNDPSIRYRSPKSPPFERKTSPRRILDHRHPNLVLLKNEAAKTSQANRILQNLSDETAALHGAEEPAIPEWVLLYEDVTAKLYGRGTLYADPNSPSFVPSSQRPFRKEDRDEVTWVPFPATSEM